MARWRAGVNVMTDDQLDPPGFGQYPFGLDPELPFIGTVWSTNREFIHHTAEIALLSDLYLRRSAQPTPALHGDGSQRELGLSR